MTFPGEFTCKELVELVTDYFEGALPVEERLRVEEHLVMCSWCRDYLEQMRATIATTGELREADLDPAMRDRLLEAFRGFRTAS
jgi:predicted anti-sigma-YlaC factor YlaD